MTKKLRLFASVMYYVLFTGLFIVLAYWVRDGLPPMNSDEKFGALCFYMLCLVAFFLFSEVYERHQGLRADLLDVLFDDHE